MSIADRLPQKQPRSPDLLDPGPDPGPAADPLQAAARAPGAGPIGPILDTRALLEHIPAHRRSTVANWFHYAARAGTPTAHGVCSQVWQGIQQRLQWASTPETRQFLQGVLDVLQAHQTEALAYAQHMISYEQLPYAERQKIKGRRALSFVMQGKEPTLPQLAYLRSLGYQGPPPVDRAQASLLIDQLRQQQGGGR